jgi:hypothetical protein
LVRRINPSQEDDSEINHKGHEVHKGAQRRGGKGLRERKEEKKKKIFLTFKK